MAITDLTNTKWLWNEDVQSSPQLTGNYAINFTSNNISYSLLENSMASSDRMKYDTTTVNYGGIWIDAAYRLIEITGGTDVTNATLIAWLEANAVQQSISTIFDLSSLSLSLGAHSIKVKAKAQGYRDSDFSNTVTYNVYQQLTTPIAVISGNRLSVSAVPHANAFEVYANDVLQTTRPFTLGTNFNLDTLNLPTGTYTIKARCIDNTVGSYYTPSEMTTAGTYTVLPQLDTPTNVSVSGTDATFDEVQNAEQYEVYVDGASIGSYTPTSGYTVTITDGAFSDGDSGSVYDTYDSPSASNFLVKVGDLPSYTVTCSSGYLLIGADGASDDYTPGNTSGGVSYVDNFQTGGSNYYRYAVSGDGTIDGPISRCIVGGTKILLADNTTKNIEDVTYDDELLVWDFYEGKLSSAKPRWIMRKRTTSEYKKVLLSDGTELRLVGQGDNCHRLFNVTKQKMLYANECVGDEVATIHGIVKVLSCEKVQETANYYNIITDTHYNLFAEGVLTSCRLSNKYKIENMKYTGEPLISEAEEQEYFDKLVNIAKER